jgi:hypothetical protein
MAHMAERAWQMSKKTASPIPMNDGQDEGWSLWRWKIDDGRKVF